MMKSLTNSFYLLLLVCFLFLGSCASPHKSKDSEFSVLEPLEKNEQREVNPEPTNKEEYDKLVTILNSLGYKGIGLEYENKEILNFLFDLFSDEITHNRRIKLIYTGLRMEYDPIHESLTIGGLRQKNEVLDYIKKKVPIRTENMQPEKL